MFAVSFVQAEANAFEHVIKKFNPETGPTATGAERFLIAASRFGGKFETTWRENVVNDLSLVESTTYNYRPALAVLGLLEGTKWMPHKE